MPQEIVTNQKYQDFDINIKLKLAALWTSLTLCYLYGDYFELYTPDKIEGLISGKNMLDNPWKLLTAAIFLAIPAVLVFLSLMLKPAVNRWLNIIFGLIFTLIMVVIGLSSLVQWYFFYVFLAFIEVVISFIIVYLAIFWPKN